MTKTRIEDLDLSRLTESEQKLLTAMFKKMPLSSIAGFACAGVVFVGVADFLLEWSKGTISSSVVFWAAFRIIVFTGLAFWARTRAFIPAALLLAFHCWVNFGMISSGKTSPLAYDIYYGFAVAFFIGMWASGSWKRLLKKAQPVAGGFSPEDGRRTSA